MSEINLKKIRFEHNLNQEQLGLIIGVTKQQIGRIESGKSNLTRENREKLLNHFPELQVPDEEENNTPDCVDIPVYGNVTASMGYGIRIYDEKQTGTYSVSKKLAKDIGLSLEHSTMIFAKGDSMEPTITGGDSLLVDTNKKEVYDGSIYCVRIDGQLYAKRLQKVPPQKIKVISDNKEKYDAFYVDLSKTINFDFEIIGEVRWWGRVAR